MKATDTALVTDLVGNRHLPASPSLIKLNKDNAKLRKNGNNQGEKLCGRCSLQCGNRCLKCVSKECPYVFMLSGGAAGFTKARVPSAKTLRARVRIKTKYDKLVTAKKVHADMESHEKCLDLRHKVPTS